jgi:PAS domain-containing protein
MSGPGSAPLTAMPFGAAVLDAAGSILAANDAFARLAGRDGRSFLERPFFEDFGKVEAIRENARPYLASPGQFDADFVSPMFGAMPGVFRIRVRSFDAGGDRRALVVVEEASEVRRLRAVESAYDLAIQSVSRCRHGINNSLMGILGHLEILLSQAGVPEAVRKRVETLLTESEKIRNCVAELDAVRKR